MKKHQKNFFRQFLHSSRRGQFVVEAIVAISVLMAGLVGIVALLSQSLHFSKFISNNYIATYLAAEGVEIVKNSIDSNVLQRHAWDCGLGGGDREAVFNSVSSVFFGQCPGQALTPFTGRTISYDATSNLYNFGGVAATGFVRRIRITRPSADEIQVNSIVSWATGISQSSVNLEDHFFNWRL